jgi:putative hydrolase of the HAD superfamily
MCAFDINSINQDAIDSIIFDLGGVIINICYENSIAAFSTLCGFDVSTLYTQHLQDPLFDQYEMGLISSDEFRNGVRHLLQIDAPNQIIDDAWNAMLLDIPKERIELLKHVGANKQIFLLSNTNEIHKTCFDRIFAETVGPDIESISHLFVKAYYSFEMGDRKPNPSIFRRVIDEQQLEPSRTLFIEDTHQHIQGAQTTGLQALHLTNGLTLLDLNLTRPQFNSTSI